MRKHICLAMAFFFTNGVIQWRIKQNEFSFLSSQIGQCSVMENVAYHTSDTDIAADKGVTPVAILKENYG